MRWPRLYRLPAPHRSLPQLLTPDPEKRLTSARRLEQSEWILSLDRDPFAGFSELASELSAEEMNPSMGQTAEEVEAEVGRALRG